MKCVTECRLIKFLCNWTLPAQLDTSSSSGRAVVHITKRTNNPQKAFHRVLLFGLQFSLLILSLPFLIFLSIPLRCSAAGKKKAADTFLWSSHKSHKKTENSLISCCHFHALCFKENRSEICASKEERQHLSRETEEALKFMFASTWMRLRHELSQFYRNANKTRWSFYRSSLGSLIRIDFRARRWQARHFISVSRFTTVYVRFYGRRTRLRDKIILFSGFGFGNYFSLRLSMPRVIFTFLSRRESCPRQEKEIYLVHSQSSGSKSKSFMLSIFSI